MEARDMQIKFLNEYHSDKKRVDIIKLEFDEKLRGSRMKKKVRYALMNQAEKLAEAIALERKKFKSMFEELMKENLNLREENIKSEIGAMKLKRNIRPELEVDYDKDISESRIKERVRDISGKIREEIKAEVRRIIAEKEKEWQAEKDIMVRKIKGEDDVEKIRKDFQKERKFWREKFYEKNKSNEEEHNE